ncbi:hypothetical protein ACS0TY_034245 [Phlomoides rotata]
MGIRQGKKETDEEYLDRVDEIILRGEPVGDKVQVHAALTGLKPDSHMFRTMSKNFPATYADFRRQAGDLITRQKVLAQRLGDHKGEEEEVVAPKTPSDKKVNTHNQKGGNAKATGSFKKFEDKEHEDKVVNKIGRSAAKVFSAIQKSGKDLLTPPNPIKSGYNDLDQRKYCYFHGSAGHNTSQCRDLLRQLWRLFEEGKLNDFVQKPPPRNKDREGMVYPKNDALIISANIFGMVVDRVLIDNGCYCNIIFKKALDQMGNLTKFVKPYDTQLKGFGNTAVTSYGRIKLSMELVSDRDEKVRITRPLKFVIVDQPNIYNGFLGRPFLETFEAVASSHFYCIKFPTTEGLVGTIKGDQIMVIKCLNYSCQFFISANSLVSNTNIFVIGEHESELLTEETTSMEVNGTQIPNRTDDLEPRLGFEPIKIDLNHQGQIHDPIGHRLTAPIEDLEHIPIDPARAECEVIIGSRIPKEMRGEVINFLKSNSDVFSWSHEDMVGIDPKHACHHLKIDPKREPISQKRRKLGPDKYVALTEEVKKLLDNRLIEIAHDEPQWVSNVVLVKKTNDKWRLCIDCTDLNDVCPKDNFPMPHIDHLVDSTAGQEMMSFMDAFAGYHQIPMYEGEIKHTYFHTENNIYSWSRMPFGLKNAGATYQRLVNTMFADQIGKTMEVYIDDIIVKSTKIENHLRDLDEAFDILRKFNMKLNPKKCNFGVESGKFLGQIIS